MFEAVAEVNSGFLGCLDVERLVEVEIGVVATSGAASEKTCQRDFGSDGIAEGKSVSVSKDPHPSFLEVQQQPWLGTCQAAVRAWKHRPLAASTV